MRVLVQRSKESSVAVANEVVGKIENDSEKEIEYLAKKVVNLRIFDDENGVMNKSILDVVGSVLSISQFTLYADPTKGNRPSYVKALNGSEARILYEKWNEALRKYLNVETGIFGADMQVKIHNDGPITIFLEKEPESWK